MRTAVRLAAMLAPAKLAVKRPARGRIRYDYLVPGGPYEEHWDWDGFFIGMSLAAEIPSEGIYLQNWCRNYLAAVRPNGFTPGLLTPRGVDRRLKHIKPFLAQGCYFASRFLRDYAWVRPHWRKLTRVLAYRERSHHDRRRNLACWHDSMESGADNNVAVLGFPAGTVAGADLNTFLYREYVAMALLARPCGRPRAQAFFARKADAVASAMRQYLWDRTDRAFYNLDRRSGSKIRRLTYASVVPLWGAVATPTQGRAMIRRHLLDPRELWARSGVRTLSAADSAYNQRNVIKPYSNWQGPVWPLVNYLAMHALLNYGFRPAARRLAVTTARLCLRDIERSGGMHENYHADTGRPLAAPNFVSWNLLVGRMLPEAEQKHNPFQLPVR